MDEIMKAALAAARAELEPQLLGCPHCAGKIINPRHHGMDFTGPVGLTAQESYPGSDRWSWSVHCWNPGCGAASLFGQTAQEAVERWNRRAT